jgi:hypothetical protein
MLSSQIILFLVWQPYFVFSIEYLGFELLTLLMFFIKVLKILVVSVELSEVEKHLLSAQVWILATTSLRQNQRDVSPFGRGDFLHHMHCESLRAKIIFGCPKASRETMLSNYHSMRSTLRMMKWKGTGGADPSVRKMSSALQGKPSRDVIPAAITSRSPSVPCWVKIV